MLDSLVKSHTLQSVRSFVGVLVGFKTLPDGQEAMIVRHLKGVDSNGLRIEGDVFTVTQGEINNAEIAAKRNTVETFKNNVSKHYLEPGAIVAFERCKISFDKKTVSASYIKDLVKTTKTEERTILMGLAKPLPVAKASTSGTASVEMILPDFKGEAKTLDVFDKEISSAWRIAYQQMKFNGISGNARAAIIITDAQKSKPVTITINSVAENMGMETIYRDPNQQEVLQQIRDNKILSEIRKEIYHNPNKHTLYVMPGFRLMVPSAKASENNYSKNTLGEFTGTFETKDKHGNVTKSDSLGYKHSIISLWRGTVSTIVPLEYCVPRLTDLESTMALKPERGNKATLTESKNKSTEASSQAASAMEELAKRIASQAQAGGGANNSETTHFQEKGTDIGNQRGVNTSIASDQPEDEFDIDLLSASIPKDDYLDGEEYANSDDVEAYFSSNLSSSMSNY